jgi:hypothetical protein
MIETPLFERLNAAGRLPMSEIDKLLAVFERFLEGKFELRRTPWVDCSAGCGWQTIR